MERITYILGAGFSAPAGLPLMNNFILKAKEAFYSKPNDLKYFGKIFTKIEELSKIKNFFKADLYNIEEVLSLFETEALLNRNTKFRSEFIQFIADVINYYTFDKVVIDPLGKASNYRKMVLGNQNQERKYACFAGTIAGIQLSKTETEYEINCEIEHIPNNTVKYSVITLNYDTLLETSLESIKERYESIEDVSFNKDSYDQEWRNPHLIKLHGCAREKNIIPPTWAKSTSPDIEKIWRVAFSVIKDSTQIRILGYSLPVTDSNVRFLLKSAILKNTTLKKIDIICLDNVKQAIKGTYDDFIDFNYYDFRNINIGDYLESLTQSTLSGRREDKIPFNALEHVHNMCIS